MTAYPLLQCLPSGISPISFFGPLIRSLFSLDSHMSLGSPVYLCDDQVRPAVLRSGNRPHSTSRSIPLPTRVSLPIITRPYVGHLHLIPHLHLCTTTSNMSHNLHQLTTTLEYPRETMLPPTRLPPQNTSVMGVHSLSQQCATLVQSTLLGSRSSLNTPEVYSLLPSSPCSCAFFVRSHLFPLHLLPSPRRPHDHTHQRRYSAVAYCSRFELLATPEMPQVLPARSSLVTVRDHLTTSIHLRVPPA